MGALDQFDRPQDRALGGAKTYPEGQNKGPGLNVETIEDNSRPAALPASPPGGSAEGASAPLSQAGQPESQGGAGNPQAESLNLVEDRGTPNEYWDGNVEKAGSQASVENLRDAAIGSSGQTGKMAQQDPEERRRAGVQMNEAAGLGTPEQQDDFVEERIYKPIDKAADKDMDTGVTDSEEGEFRKAAARATIGGKEEADKYIKEQNPKKKDETDHQYEQRIREMKTGFWSKMKAFWHRGKDDPDTEAREDKEMEVTSFMGGMTRQELGMFVFQWGAMMMSNADKGFGGAMGAAGQGALAGHQARGNLEEENEHRRAMELREAERKESTETINTEQGIFQWNPKTKAYDIPLTDPEDPSVRLTPSALASRPPVDKWKIDRLVAMGIPEDKASRYILLGVNPAKAKQQALSEWGAFERDNDATITIGGKTYTKRDVKRGDIPDLKQQFVNEYLAVFGFEPGEGGAALTGGGGGDGGSALPDPVEPRMTAKPSNWSTEDWEAYNSMHDEMESLAAGET